MNEKKALETIGALDKFGINLGLSRIGACLEALGNPQLRYPTIHVGGTNGKGSTCAFTANILKEAGLKTGLYTSPPLNSFGERMRIGGVPMSNTLVPELLSKVLEAAARSECSGMTQFEVITAMAFLHFEREKVDAAVIEVGLGGRLDSTNVIMPVAVGVTNVGLEHSAYLGPTVEAIALEKAGIAKKGVLLATTAREPALGVLRGEAARAGAPFAVLGEDFDLTADDAGFHFKGRKTEVGSLVSGLPGPFQKQNLALSLALVEELQLKGWPITDTHIRQGAKTARWPGRLELFGAGPRVLLDGAHNPHAALALAEALKEGFQRKRLFLILGILDDKDAESILETLTPLADRVILTRSASRRAIDPEELEERARTLHTGAGVAADIGAALKMARREANAGDLIVITGSLTLVGEARSLLEGAGEGG